MSNITFGEVLDNLSDAEQKYKDICSARKRKRDNVVGEFGIRMVTTKDLSSGSVIVAQDHIRMVHNVKQSGMGFSVKQQIDNGESLTCFYDANEAFSVLDKLCADNAVELVRT